MVYSNNIFLPDFITRRRSINQFPIPNSEPFRILPYKVSTPDSDSYYLVDAYLAPLSCHIRYDSHSDSLHLVGGFTRSPRRWIHSYPVDQWKYKLNF